MTLQQIRQTLDTRPLLPFQMLVVALGVLINLLDGYDILALSVISPILTREWQLGPETLGLLLSATLVGTAVGGFMLSPIADLWGRRTSILINNDVWDALQWADDPRYPADRMNLGMRLSVNIAIYALTH